MSGRRKRRSEDRRHREHRSLKQHHRHVKGTSDGLCLASMIAAAECPHPFHANEDECMERMLDLALDRGQIVLDHVWRLVLVPDVVAIGGPRRAPSARPSRRRRGRRAASTAVWSTSGASRTNSPPELYAHLDEQGASS